MINWNFRRPEELCKAWVPTMLFIAGAVMLLVAVSSCHTLDETVVVLPHVSGANFIGSKECAQCHDEIYRDFKTATHARLQAKGTNAINMGCEACHGPGSLHAESGGDKPIPVNYKPGTLRVLPAPQRQAIVHPRPTSENCFECHADIRGKFALPQHHQVPEHRINCSDCHDPHKGSAVKGGTALLAENENCLRCHASQRGPFVFEHEAMRNGCTVCHDPHGSINQKMLVARNHNLCINCHFQQVRSGRILIGGSDHTIRVQQGTCWTAGCHEAVHGSHVSSSLRF